MDTREYDIGDAITLIGVFTTRPTRGTIDAGDNQLTVHDPAGYTTGNTIVVRGAGLAGEDLVTTISAISGATLTLAAAASTSVVGADVGIATNPTTVACKVKKPDGTVTAPAASQVSTGRYEASFEPDQSGTHYYRFEGTGAAHAAGERAFLVVEKRVA